MEPQPSSSSSPSSERGGSLVSSRFCCPEEKRFGARGSGRAAAAGCIGSPAASLPLPWAPTREASVCGWAAVSAHPGQIPPAAESVHGQALREFPRGSAAGSGGAALLAVTPRSRSRLCSGLGARDKGTK